MGNLTGYGNPERNPKKKKDVFENLGPKTISERNDIYTIKIFSSRPIQWYKNHSYLRLFCDPKS